MSPKIPHIEAYQQTRYKVVRSVPTFESGKDIGELDEIWRQYMIANEEFSAYNSDETMIALIGAWARATRIINTIWEKY